MAYLTLVRKTDLKSIANLIEVNKEIAELFGDKDDPDQWYFDWQPQIGSLFVGKKDLGERNFTDVRNKLFDKMQSDVYTKRDYWKRVIAICDWLEVNFIGIVK